MRPTAAAPRLGMTRGRLGAARRWLLGARGPAIRPERREINLALQGGGSHGAFTWGVLDRLLDDRDLAIAALSGTSAGAINAVLLAAGLADGPAAAQEKLARFWSTLSAAAPGDAMTGGLFEAFHAMSGLQRAQQAGFDLIGKFLAPAQFNPLGFNPMRDLLRDLVDFERLRQAGPRLFIAATDAATGRKRIFGREEMSVEAVLASACLPQLHHPVEIDGRFYWDGGYVSNPPLLPLALEDAAEDTLLVQLIPLAELSVPSDHAGIGEGLNRVIFNNPLRQEIDALRLLAEVDPRSRPATHRFHLIDATPTTQALPPGSRLSPDRRLIADLRVAGRTAAEAWLADHSAAIGTRATTDLAARFL